MGVGVYKLGDFEKRGLCVPLLINTTWRSTRGRTATEFLAKWRSTNPEHTSLTFWHFLITEIPIYHCKKKTKGFSGSLANVLLCFVVCSSSVTKISLSISFDYLIFWTIIDYGLKKYTIKKKQLYKSHWNMSHTFGRNLYNKIWDPKQIFHLERQIVFPEYITKIDWKSDVR